ncbi:MAG: chemotaxis protein CheR [Denitrovibrio sp.]|nr:MAG: chemotaxis protein CheR [Denitrovibrio sp.]
MSKQSKSSEVIPDYYVAIGASAGGLEAIEKFFSNMPDDSGLSFIVIQHLSPDYKSLMVELLSKHTKMPVHRAEDGVLIEKNNVYLIPPKHNLTIFHGKLLLSDRGSRISLNLPIDIFFNSLAIDQGEKSVGIVLSGTGSDGTRGVKSIKEANGVVIAQSEETAQFDAMPKNAIMSGSVDMVLAPEEMPESLLSYIKNPYVAKVKRAGSQSTVDKLLAMVREKTKVDFTHYKPSTILRRIERRIAVNKLDSLDEYLDMLEQSPNEVTLLYKDVLIGVTSFFRDKESYEYLKTKVIPEIINNNNGIEDIRVWTSGCSTGEEAYSLAILFYDCIQDLNLRRKVKIFATDIDEDAILIASNGQYHESIVGDVPSSYLTRYFTKQDNTYIISRNIREMVVFAKHNLIKDPPFTKMDLISCRNLLIYFQPVLQKKALEMFSFSLNMGGYLFLGSSEATGEVSENYEVVENKHKIFKSVNRTRRISSDHDLRVMHEPVHSNRYFRASGRDQTSYYGYGDEKIYDKLLRAVTSQSESAIIVVNDQLDIIHLFGDVATYIDLPIGKMNSDISKLAKRELAIPLSTGVQRVLKKNEDTIYTNIIIKENGQSRNVKMTIKQLFNKNGNHIILAIIIEKEREKIIGKRVTEADDYDVGKEVQQRIIDLEQELQFTKENLQATIEELETSNEELQATNEELLASNEELQSTNEELQSVNEELFTVNSEHQDKIFELTELNNDLDNLLNSTQIGTLFLDENLCIRKFTPMVTKVMNIMESDKGRPMTDLTHKMVDIDILALVRRVYIESKSLEIETRDVDGNWYFVRILPYQIGPSIFSGVVVTFIEINDVKAVSKELDKQKFMRDLTDEEVKIGHWDWNIKTDEIVWINVAPVFGLKEGEFGGTYDDFLKIVHPEDKEKVKNAVRNSLENSEKYSLEHRIVTKNGDVRWVHEFGQVKYGKGKEAVRMMGVVRDITDKVSISDELEDKLMFLESLNSAAPIGIGMVKDRVFTYVNPYLEGMTGYTSEELIGKKSSIVYPSKKEYERVGKAKYKQIDNEGKGCVDTKWKCKDGSIIYVTLSSVPLDADDLSKGVVFTLSPR